MSKKLTLVALSALMYSHLPFSWCIAEEKTADAISSTNNQTNLLHKGRPRIALSSTQVTSLYTALSATSNTAGADAIRLLTTIADSHANLALALFNIVNALTQPDTDHPNQAPLDVATNGVKVALATTNIPSRYGTNTLLHYAAHFDILASVIDQGVDASTRAAKVVSTLLSGLTNAQRTTALTAKDQWSSTPLHYAALSSDSAATVMKAMLRDISNSTTKATLVGATNTWGYTPIHYAAASTNGAIIDPLFLNITPAQKLVALSVKDQWDSTPFHYAALAGNTSIIDPLFLTGISTTQLYTLITTKNKFDSTPLHYAPFADTRSIIDPLFLKMTAAQKNTAINLKNQWGLSPLMIATLPRIQDRNGSWSLAEPASAFFAALIQTPTFEMASIVWPSILGSN